MSVSARISDRIKHMPKAHPFCTEYFREFGSRMAVNKAMSRLVEAGVLVRLARGIYMRPKISPYAGSVRPSTSSILRVIARRNRETTQIHGAEAVRQFNLSTQMQVVSTFYTSGSSRELRFGRKTLRLQHVAQVKLQHAGTKVGLALVALFYLGKAGVDSNAVAKIRSRLSPVEFEALQSCQMPKWMKVAVQ